MRDPDLWARLTRNIAEPSNDQDCWTWSAARDRWGYGRVSFRIPGVGVRKKMAHRLAYEQVHGPIPRGYQIDHLCCNASCINPDHLEAVTPSVNARRRSRGG